MYLEQRFRPGALCAGTCAACSRPSSGWTPTELEPPVDDSEFAHGAYPQRFKDLSAGPRDNWGWFSHLGTTAHYAHAAIAFTDWHAMFKELEALPDEDTGSAAPQVEAASGASQEDAASLSDALYEAGTRAAVAMFVDAHNTGYYINSYTAKLNPTMDTVLEKLLAGVRRLQDEWREADFVPPGKDDAPASRKSGFARTMQILSRFESSFHAVSWQSGRGLGCPML